MTASPASLVPVARDVVMLDLHERGRPRITAGYFIAAPRPAILDTGPARSVPRWLEALQSAGVRPVDVAYIIVTHIHLDHSGGVGQMLRHAPAAQVAVHPRGARHLTDPSRLIAGAQAVFGPHLETYFGVPEPVPESRIMAMDDGATLDLGGGHTLRFIEAPGHARHQHMVWDGGTGTLFAGDELGERLPDVADDYVMVDTAPNQFDPEAMVRSAQRLTDLRPEAILLSHFGRYPGSSRALYERLMREISVVAGLGRRGDRRTTVEEVTAALIGHVRAELAARGITVTPEVAGVLEERLAVSAQGVADYHARRDAGKG